MILGRVQGPPLVLIIDNFGLSQAIRLKNNSIRRKILIKVYHIVSFFSDKLKYDELP